MGIDLFGCMNGIGDNLALVDKTIDEDVESNEDRENREFLRGIRYNLSYYIKNPTRVNSIETIKIISHISVNVFEKNKQTKKKKKKKPTSNNNQQQQQTK